MNRWRWDLLQRVRHRPGRSVLVVALLTALGLAGAGGSLYLRAHYHYSAARQAEQEHRLSLAQKHIDLCLPWCPRQAAVHFLAARIARRRGASRDAEQHLDECERLEGSRTEALGLERILLQVQQGDLSPEAERYLASYVGRGAPEAPLILEALARGYLEIPRYPAALDCANRCLQQQPDDIPALLLRGRTREGMSSFEALDDYRRVLELDPDNDEARLRLAETLFTFGRADEAAPHFELLHGRRPADPAARLGLARCRYHAGRLDEARGLLGALIAEDPRNLGALRELGRLELEAGRGAEAERRLQEALAIDPSDRDTNHLLAQALLQQGKERDARLQEERSERVRADLTRVGEILNVEMKAKPRDPALCFELSNLYLRYGKQNQGVRWLLRALEYDPHYEPARQALADGPPRTRGTDQGAVPSP